MTKAPKEPVWLDKRIVLAIHEDLIAQHGGLAGLRDDGLFESALARPQNRWMYGEATDLFECAASYGFGLAKNHAFSDGNKRTAFQAMYTFLGLNDVELSADEAETVHTMVGVAEGSVSEKALAAWLRKNTPKPRRKRGG